MAPISINGTTGISGVDGTAGTPALRGSDTNTGIVFGADVIIGSTNGTEAFRVDSSGRLGLGASAPDERLVVAGAIRATSNATNWAASDGAVIDYYAGDMRIIAARAGANSSTIRFHTYNSGTATERMRIQSDGAVVCDTGIMFGGMPNTSRPNADGPLLWNSSLPRSGWYSSFISNQTGYPYAYGPILGYNETGNNSGYAFQIFKGFSGTALYFRVGDGGGANTWGGWQSFNITAVSDQRVKENIVSSQSTLDTIKSLRVVDFNYTQESGYNDRKTHKGLIAQEVLGIAPDVVEHMGDPEKEETTLALKYEKLVPYLIKALQESQARIESLETRLAALEVTQ